MCKHGDEVTITEADRIIELGDLPTSIRLAREMKAHAQAEIQELLNADIEAHVAAAYGELDLLAEDYMDLKRTQEDARL